MITISSDINTVLWDLDGTLLNSFTILESLIHDISPLFGIESPTSTSLLANFHGSLRDTFDNVFKGVLSQHDIDRFEQLFIAQQGVHYQRIAEHLLLDAIELSSSLAKRGVRQIIATNRDHKRRGYASPRSIVERSILGDYINHIVSGDDTEFRKPDPRVLEVLIGKLGVSMDEMVVIGDQYVDAQFAFNLGCSAIIVARDNLDFHHEKLTYVDWQKNISVVDSLRDVCVS